MFNRFISCLICSSRVVPYRTNNAFTMPVHLLFWGKEENRVAVVSELAKYGFKLDSASQGTRVMVVNVPLKLPFGIDARGNDWSSNSARCKGTRKGRQHAGEVLVWLQETSRAVTNC